MDDKVTLNKIYNEDCLIGMCRIPDRSVDAIICDLPYGITNNEWDSIIPLDKLWIQYKRIIKPFCPIVLFSQFPFDKILAMSNIEMFKYQWIWEKDNATGFLNSKYAPLKAHETILIFSEGGVSPTSVNRMPYNPVMWKAGAYKTVRRNHGTTNYGKYHDCTTESNGDRFPVDIISFKSDKDGFHPTQKPVDLIRYLVLTYTHKGDTVLDNCMGSGTTAIACIREGRNFIGFETNKKYYELANKRINDELQQLTLF